MKKIISYSLWGDNPKYIVGAKKNIELAKKFFPDWTIHLYLSETTNFEYESDNLEIISKKAVQNYDGMFWRFESCDSDDIVIVRDLDDRLSERHKFVVDEWLDSDKNIHLIKDHPNHTNLVMGGLWGARNGIFKGLKNIISNWIYKNNYNTDQIFLARIFNNYYISKSFVHDSYYNSLGIERKIEMQRNNFEFLGDTFDENDIRVESYRKIIEEYEEKNKN